MYVNYSKTLLKNHPEIKITCIISYLDHIFSDQFFWFTLNFYFLKRQPQYKDKKIFQPNSGLIIKALWCIV